jgi:peptide deformylase
VAFQLVNAFRRGCIGFSAQTDFSHGFHNQPDNQSKQKQSASNGRFQNRDRSSAQFKKDLVHETNIERFGAKNIRQEGKQRLNKQAHLAELRVDRDAAISYVRRMTKRPIITIPDPVLREVCAPIEKVDAETIALADDMLETMYDAPGIGLAASQVGILKRIFVLDVAKEDAPKEPMVFINPEIIWSSDELSVYQEGCLSIPDYYEDVERPAEVAVKFMDREGAEQEIKADGLLATCIQHELDHLNGKLFIDYLSKLKRDRVVKKFTKQAKLAGQL